MPILSNILMTAEGDSAVRLAATDLYLGVDAMTQGKVSQGGTVAVSARTLFDIVKNLPDGEVEWKLDGAHASIRCGKVEYRIPGMSGDDFPPLPSPEGGEFAELEADQVSTLIGLTQYSISADDTRPHLAGALFETDGKVLRMVTTDGHRLSKAESSMGDASTASFSMLIPNKGIAELKRLIEDAKQEKKDGPPTISVAVVGGNAFFKRDGIQLSVKLADEQFPPYDKVIPQSQGRRAVTARQRLLEALRRISLVASDKSGGVRLALEPGILRITSENPEIGEGKEEVDVDYAGEPLTIGFNARYMLDVLGSMTTDEVALEFNGELDPGVLRPVGDDITDFVGVIMPMRI